MSNLTAKLKIRKNDLDENDIWEKILNNYKNFRKKNPGPEKDGYLVFSSRQEELDFFNSEAQAGLTFLAQEYLNDQPQDFYLFSCGDFRLYSGTLQEIVKSLEAVIANEPNNLNAKNGLTIINSYQQTIPTLTMREQIRTCREEAQELEDSEKYGLSM